MAHHAANGTRLILVHPNSDLALIERVGTTQALNWALAPGQTVERLEKALKSYHDLPKLPPTADLVRAEANVVENTLELPASTIRAVAGTNGVRQCTLPATL